MKALLILILVIILVGGGLRMAGIRLPLIDYPIGPLGSMTPVQLCLTSRSSHPASATSKCPDL